MSYDSRRGGENDFFGRASIRSTRARYATYGDGSERRTLAGATQRFSARVERGLDWVELGDVVARPTADKDALLAGYQRLAGRRERPRHDWRAHLERLRLAHAPDARDAAAPRRRRLGPVRVRRRRASRAPIASRSRCARERTPRA